MSLKGRSFIAVLLFCIILSAHYYPTTTMSLYIRGIVYSTQNFSVFREWLYNEPYVISVFDNRENTLKNYIDITKVDQSYNLAYKEPFTIYAASNGVVIFSAHKASAKKAMIVSYDNGYTAHYDHLTTIHKLPYTAIKKGQRLATDSDGIVNLIVFQNGKRLDEQQVVRWIIDET